MFVSSRSSLSSAQNWEQLFIGTKYTDTAPTASRTAEHAADKQLIRAWDTHHAWSELFQNQMSEKFEV